MRIAIIHFSQTGNTRKVARAMEQGFREAGHVVKRYSMKKADLEDAASCDMIGVGAPCFSSRAPQPILDLIASLPPLPGRPAFVFATSGGGPGRVLYEMTEALREKRADVKGGILIRGECFHPFPAILGRFPGRPDQNDLDDAKRFALRVAEWVSSGRDGPLPGTRQDALRPGKGFYDYVARINTDEDLRKSLKAPEAVPGLCDQCGWCQAECPVNNITMEPYPVLGDKCIRCYRCYSGCPQQAITAEIKFGNFLTHVFYNTAFERWLGDVKAGEKFY